MLIIAPTNCQMRLEKKVNETGSLALTETYSTHSSSYKQE